MQHTGSDRLVLVDLPVADVVASRTFSSRWEVVWMSPEAVERAGQAQPVGAST